MLTSLPGSRSAVLIVEDEPEIASFLERGFRANGLDPTVVDEGARALTLARTGDFDAVVLDVGLPDADGLWVLRQLRATAPLIPVVILSARTTVDEVVAGFECGADDYMTKPFRFDELLARVQLRLRRADRDREGLILRVDGCALDTRTRRLTVGGVVVELSAREFALAETFFTHPGEVFSREQLLSRVWGYEHDPASNVVDVYVGYLRRKIGPGRIRTVRGMGYRLEPGVEPREEAG